MNDLALVDDFIFTSNVVPAQLCDSFISSIEGREEWSTHEWTREVSEGNSAPMYADEPHPNDPQSIMECSVLNGNKVEDISLLSRYLKKAIDSYSDVHKNLQSNVSTIVSPKFNRYEEGCQMPTHVDHIKSLFDGRYRGIPVLSIVGLVGDKFEGGEFYCREKEIPLNKGDVLIFPSCFLYPHEVRRISSGVRYSFVSWAF